MPQPIRTLSILIAGLFLTMVFVATTCEAVHGLSHDSQESHHSNTKPLHGVLCNWACHNGKLSSTSLTTSPSWHSPLQALGAVLSLYALPGSLPSHSNESSRAPPPVLLSFFS